MNSPEHKPAVMKKPPTLLAKVVLLLLYLLFNSNPHAAEIRPVAILISDSVQAYRDTAQVFSTALDMPTRIYDLQGDIRRNPRLKKQLFDDNPRLILALGAKAAFVAKLWTRDHQEIPVVFAMVLNWPKYKLLDGQKNIIGIASETAPGNQFTSLALFAPKVRRVGVIYSPTQSRHIIEEATQAAQALGLELITMPIRDKREVRIAYRQLVSQVDAFWMLNDPVTFTVKNMAWMNKRCIQDRKICIGQSENAAKLGFMLSVNPDQKNIGLQAASVARNVILHGISPNHFRIMPPLGTEILVNMKTARKIGLYVKPSVLAIATRVIE